MNTLTSFFVADITINIILRALFTFGVFIVLRTFITKWIINLFKKFAEKKDLKLMLLIIDTIEVPLKTFFLFAGIYFSLIILPLNLLIVGYLNTIFRSIVIITVARCFLRMEEGFIIIQENLDMKNSNFKTIGLLIAKIIKVLVVVLAVVAIAYEFGFNLNSLLAGLGIGGLAIAMAAQDALKNFFGGFIILSDNPFQVGDIVRVDSEEGIIEEVGIRSTKIRTFEKELISIPNSKFTDGVVINMSRRGLRRFKFHVGATYSTTTEQLRSVVNEIYQMLKEHELIDKDSVLVKFDGFGGSSLDILVMYFVTTPDFVTAFGIKEDINFKIMEIFEKNNVEFAFPSMSVYLENEDK